MEGLRDNTSLKYLDLSHNLITWQGCTSLKCCLEFNTSLEELNCSYN